MTHLQKIRTNIIIFSSFLFLSGLTAIPLESEIGFILSRIDSDGALYKWMLEIFIALKKINIDYPYLHYGYDWLAFAHLLFAILFLGTYRNPKQNIWIFQFGVVACLLIIPTAFIAGQYREIPLYWILIDCSFGVLGLIPLLYTLKLIKHVKTIDEA